MTLFNQNVGVELVADICASPVSVAFAFYYDSSSEFHINVDGSIKFPIPGLSVDVPDVNIGVGVFGVASVDTSTDRIDILLGLTACVNVVVLKECFPDPPLEVIDFGISVNNFCQ